MGRIKEWRGERRKGSEKKMREKYIYRREGGRESS